MEYYLLMGLLFNVFFFVREQCTCFICLQFDYELVCIVCGLDKGVDKTILKNSHIN